MAFKVFKIYNIVLLNALNVGQITYWIPNNFSPFHEKLE
jgi:hypothetical protein